MKTSVWHDLTHESAMNAVEAVIAAPLSNFCLARNSYINRVFEMELLSKERIIVKFYRPGRWTVDMILGEHDFLQKCAALELPVIPPQRFNNKTLFTLGTIPFAIFPKKGGRAIDELNEDLWKETGRLLGRVHNVGQPITNSGRPIWRPSVVSNLHLETLLDANVIPPDYLDVIARVITTFIQKADPLFSDHDLFLIHGDCHFGNIIYRLDESLYIVDFDDAVVGPAIQDLWMLLPDTVENCAKEIAWFKEGYSTFRPFPTSSLKLIPALKVMRQIHFASWCAIQSTEAQFIHHFPEWGSTRYWNELSRGIMAY